MLQIGREDRNAAVLLQHIYGNVGRWLVHIWALSVTAAASDEPFRSTGASRLLLVVQFYMSLFHSLSPRRRLLLQAGPYLQQDPHSPTPPRFNKRTPHNQRSKG